MAVHNRHMVHLDEYGDKIIIYNENETERIDITVKKNRKVEISFKEITMLVDDFMMKPERDMIK